ncbi:MAG: nickel-dependent hydrogenase large subunit [Bifidobacteriaceae bacterium]|nr:nickel-dependent hydrogenase large subunit [Bifidobacteriaceae bacterium]
MTTRLILDAALDPAGARIVVDRGPDGTVQAARFDMSGLPRVDTILTGRPVVDVPALVERLCGVCPTAHHLAGIQALEALHGVVEIPPAAEIVRRLLHHGSVLAVHATRFALGDPDAAVLRGLAKLAAVAAGSPGHFPVTAIVGGIAAPVAPDAVARCREVVPEALVAAQRLAQAALDDRVDRDGSRGHRSGGGVAHFSGADVALVDPSGAPDLLGAHLRAVAADGTVLVDRAEPAEWDTLVAEEIPASSAPRPYLAAFGPDRGRYRVGPVAQLRVGTLRTPRAAGLQREWRAAGGGALAARATMAVHAVEAISGLIDAIDPDDTDIAAARPSLEPRAGVGVGWVDGARGVLVHRYEVTDAGTVRGAIVLTPTAQNEPWLADLLRQEIGDPPNGPLADGGSVEAAIRDVDPCLPCTAAPPGAMGIVVETQARKAGT